MLNTISIKLITALL